MPKKDLSPTKIRRMNRIIQRKKGAVQIQHGEKLRRKKGRKEKRWEAVHVQRTGRGLRTRRKGN